MKASVYLISVFFLLLRTFSSPFSPTIHHLAQLCLDLGNKVGHGSVVYSQSPVKQSGSGSSSDAANTTQSSLQEGYPEGSIASV